jgi:hypothetical protein
MLPRSILSLHALTTATECFCITVYQATACWNGGVACVCRQYRNAYMNLRDRELCNYLPCKGFHKHRNSTVESASLEGRMDLVLVLMDWANYA